MTTPVTDRGDHGQPALSGEYGVDFAGGWVSSVRWSHPCPGQCNRAFRRHEQARLLEWHRVVEGVVWADYGDGWTLAADPHLVSEGGRRTGSPHWCTSCSSRILEDLARFPDLCAALWDAGHDPNDEDVVDADGRPRLRVVVKRDLALVGRSTVWVDELACGHRFTFTWHPPLAPAPYARRCSRCVLDRSQVDAGKIQTGAAGRGTTSRRTGSPSGSPAWDAIDELVSWAADAEDRVRGYFRLARDGRNPHQGSAAARSQTLTRAVRFLLEHGEQLLALPEGVEIGRRIQALAQRADRAAAHDHLVHRLPAACPKCHLKTLQREDGSDVVRCRRGCDTWTAAEYQRMVRTSVEGQRA